MNTCVQKALWHLRCKAISMTNSDPAVMLWLCAKTLGIWDCNTLLSGRLLRVLNCLVVLLNGCCIALSSWAVAPSRNSSICFILLRCWFCTVVPFLVTMFFRWFAFVVLCSEGYSPNVRLSACHYSSSVLLVPQKLTTMPRSSILKIAKEGLEWCRVRSNLSAASGDG